MLDVFMAVCIRITIREFIMFCFSHSHVYTCTYSSICAAQVKLGYVIFLKHTKTVGLRISITLTFQLFLCAYSFRLHMHCTGDIGICEMNGNKDMEQ